MLEPNDHDPTQPDATEMPARMCERASRIGSAQEARDGSAGAREGIATTSRR